MHIKSINLFQVSLISLIVVLWSSQLGVWHCHYMTIVLADERAVLALLGKRVLSAVGILGLIFRHEVNWWFRGPL